MLMKPTPSHALDSGLCRCPTVTQIVRVPYAGNASVVKGLHEHVHPQAQSQIEHVFTVFQQQITVARLAAKQPGMLAASWYQRNDSGADRQAARLDVGRYRCGISRLARQLFGTQDHARTAWWRPLGGGGQQQQLAIARALVAEASFIIPDEPTEGIQFSIVKNIGRVISMLRERGDIGILLCGQYFDFACELADTFAVMSHGEVVVAGDRSTIGSDEVRGYLSV